jgi:hypothetical protein
MTNLSVILKIDYRLELPRLKQKRGWLTRRVLHKKKPLSLAAFQSLRETIDIW